MSVLIPFITDFCDTLAVRTVDTKILYLLVEQLMSTRCFMGKIHKK